jgi:AraC-like DNA-binding protein
VLFRSTWEETLVLQVQQYININVSRNIKLSDISHEVCFSANHLNTIYKSVTGKTIIQYAEAYKIEKAKELLENTHECLASIAEQLGYYDQYHFIKIFKKETGFTPTQFRKR